MKPASTGTSLQTELYSKLALHNMEQVLICLLIPSEHWLDARLDTNDKTVRMIFTIPDHMKLNTSCG